MEKIEFTNKENLKWAREKSGFDLPYIYKKINWVPKTEKIEKWENGSDFPTINELRKLGEVYKCSWVIFILKEKVSDLDFRVVEFRKIFGTKQEDISPHLLEFLNELKKKQDFLIEFADTLNLKTNHLIGICKKVKDKKNMAEEIVSRIGINMDTFWKKPTRRDGFKYLAECLAQKNIFVVSSSSHHYKSIPVEQMRGVLLNHEIAVIIGINAQKEESYGARIFTIFHELTHILKGDSFNGDAEITKIDFRDRSNVKDEREAFCDATAAQILIPNTVLKKINVPITKELVEKKCKELKVNHQPLLYRMQDFGLLSQKRVTDLLVELKEDKIDNQHTQNKKDIRIDGGRLKVLQNGTAFVRAVNILHSKGEITFTQVLSVLGVKATAYKKFAERI